MNRQKRTLFLLLGVLVLAIGYAFLRTPRQERVASPAPQLVSQKRTASAVAPERENSEFLVQVDLLHRKKIKFPGVRRNIFGPLYTVAPPPPPPPPVRVVPPPPVEVQVPVMETVRQQLARFTFLGYLEKDREKTVFLSSNDEIFVVKQGEHLGKDNEYLVTELTPERLILQLKGDPRKITVPLIDQAPLAPTMMKMPPLSPSPLSSGNSRGTGPGGFVRRYPGRGLPTPPAPEENLDTDPAEVLPDLQQPVTGGEESPAEEVIQ